MHTVRLTRQQWAEARRLREKLHLSLREIAIRLGVHARDHRQARRGRGLVARAPGRRA